MRTREMMGGERGYDGWCPATEPDELVGQWRNGGGEQGTAWRRLRWRGEIDCHTGQYGPSVQHVSLTAPTQRVRPCPTTTRTSLNATHHDSPSPTRTILTTIIRSRAQSETVKVGNVMVHTSWREVRWSCITMSLLKIKEWHKYEHLFFYYTK